MKAALWGSSFLSFRQILRQTITFIWKVARVFMAAFAGAGIVGLLSGFLLALLFAIIYSPVAPTSADALNWRDTLIRIHLLILFLLLGFSFVLCGSQAVAKHNRTRVGIVLTVLGRAFLLLQTADPDGLPFDLLMGLLSTSTAGAIVAIIANSRSRINLHFH